MWANDYLLWMRATSPVQEYLGEDGVAVSKCFHTGKKGFHALELERTAYGISLPPPITEDERFQFSSLFSQGEVCYVYTEAIASHTLCFSGNVTRILVNGRSKKFADGQVYVEKGDHILFRCEKERNEWQFCVDSQSLAISILQSQRGHGDRMVCVGPFFGKGIHPPEYKWDFSKVFINQKGERLYWQFRDGSQLRLYLDSVFFGQWFYALMVGFYGIRKAAELLEDEPRQRLFCRNMHHMAKYFGQ